MRSKEIINLKLIVLLLPFTFCAWTLHAQTMERKQLFDFDWKFALQDHAGVEKFDFDDSGWRTLDLPHDWSIESRPNPNNPSKGDGGFFDMGIGWYRKSFHAPQEWNDKKVAIYFEGVYMNSEVFINGNSLGVQPYGYTSFMYDLTPFLDFGKENILSVKVDNGQQRNSRWYSGSGIYRHVWLMVTDKIHIKHWGVTITTPEIRQNAASIRVDTKVNNETDLEQNIQLTVSIIDKNGIPVVSDTQRTEISSRQNKQVISNIKVKKPLLWSPEAPNLYKAHVAIKQHGKVIDSLTYNFGIRSIEFSAQKGFILNGKKVALNGGCVHHDNGCLGAKAYDRAEERKVELLKTAGFNAVRTSHNPPSESFLNACDRLGLLVIDEVFDGWRVTKTEYDYATHFDQWWEHDLSSMVLRDINHPSIIMWSIGNEIIERTKPEAIETAKKLTEKIKAVDTTRPVTSAMTTWNEGWDIFDPLMAVHDIAGYNYQLQRAESDHERVPSRIILQTESYPKDAFFCWDMVQKNNYIIGDFVWTAMDYLGESGIGRYYYTGEPHAEHWMGNLYPWHGAYCGDIDLTGWRKPISHYRDMLYNNSDKLYMAVREPSLPGKEIKLTMWAVWPLWESWTWLGLEGKDMEVEVYTKYDSVRLYLNDKLIEEKQITRENQYKAVFSLPYTEGKLSAVAVRNGKEILSTSLETAGEPVKIRLVPDRETIVANGEDLCYVSVQVVDKKGIVCFPSDNLLQFEVKGEGEIIGVDNANLKDTDPYTGNFRKAWNGKALVVIKSNKNTGLIELKASAFGLESSDLTIKTKSPVNPEKE